MRGGSRRAIVGQDMAARDGWTGLFASAFKRSRNAMVLVGDDRVVIDVNPAYVRLVGHRRDALLGQPLSTFVADRPLASAQEWARMLAAREFTGRVELVAADGSTVAVQWGAHVEVVTGRRLVLFVALSTSTWGGRFRRTVREDAAPIPLSARELEIVRLIAHGESGPEIAAELHIAHDTVRTHVRNAMHKVGARSRAHLVAKVLGEGYALA
jgi:PAS domain S-box-containing protein